jgi:hypothetical protein
MRYRLEMLDDESLVIHNVETGLILGEVIPHLSDHPHDAAKASISGCTVLNGAGLELTRIINPNFPSPLRVAAIAVANHEKHYDYPGLRKHSAEPCLPNRVEQLLGALLADICAEVARGIIQCGNGGLEGSTKERCAGLIAELHRIWYASRFGSFDDETRLAYDHYFCNTTSAGGRLSFRDAAALYGMMELRERFADIGDAALRQVLDWPLKLLRSTLARISLPAPASGGKV